MSGYDLGAMVVLSVFVLLMFHGESLIEVLRRWNRDKGEDEGE